VAKKPRKCEAGHGADPDLEDPDHRDRSVSSGLKSVIVRSGRTPLAGSFSPSTFAISGYTCTLSNGWPVVFFRNAGPEAMNMARILGSSLSYPCVPDSKVIDPEKSKMPT
jgi:hypothetical protein